MLRKRYLWLLGGAATCALLLAASGQSRAETWKLAHWLPPAHSFAKSLNEWAHNVQSKSNGTLKVQVYPAGQLGKAPTHYDMARDGIADVTWINPGFNPGRWPITSLGEQFLMVGDPARGSAALTRWYKGYADREMGDVHFCLMHTMEHQTVFSTTRPIKRPEDMKGLKVRPSTATQARLVTAAGGSTVFFPLPKVREPVERGLVQVVFGGPKSLIIFGGHGKMKYGTRHPLNTNVWMMVINKRAYTRLSADHKRVVDGECSPTFAAKIGHDATVVEQTGWDEWIKLGKTIVEVSKEDEKAWRRAAQKVLATWKTEVKERGFDADKIRADLVAKLKAENALIN